MVVLICFGVGFGMLCGCFCRFMGWFVRFCSWFGTYGWCFGILGVCFNFFGGCFVRMWFWFCFVLLVVLTIWYSWVFVVGLLRCVCFLICFWGCFGRL